MRTMRRRKKKTVLTIVLVVLIAALAILLLLKKGQLQQKTAPASPAVTNTEAPSVDQSNSLLGAWRYDADTEYTFAADGSGAMIAGGTTYSFRYTAEGQALLLDFADEMLLDSTYEFTVNGDTLTLVGKTGTVGGVYSRQRVQ